MVIAVDSSAVIAILYEEADSRRVRSALQAASNATISAANILELQLVVAGSRSRTGWNEVEAIFAQYNIAIHIFDERQLRIAREAAVRYGKGRHKAALNFGDCFAYALAKSQNLPLLCVGADLVHTDLKLA